MHHHHVQIQYAYLSSMLKVLSAAQVKIIDKMTIEQEPVTSLDLMERAARAFTDWFCTHYSDAEPVTIICGTGNNGGDGLAVARLLALQRFPVRVIHCDIGNHSTPDFTENLKRLKRIEPVVPLIEIQAGDPLPQLSGILIDAIFGSGLNREVSGYWGELLAHINASGCPAISIDIPSGLFADKPSPGQVIRAQRTFSFELPKLAFMIPENSDYTGAWATGPIGLLPEAIEQAFSPYFLLQKSDISSRILTRRRFDHKGKFGHALLIAGKKGSIGAGVLAAQAALRCGVGLLTTHLPGAGYSVMQSSLPEAMVSTDLHEEHLTHIPDVDPFTAVGCGCGIGTSSESASALQVLLASRESRLVLDADALNLIAANNLHKIIPRHSILTPHLKEFERLFGESNDHFARLELLRKVSEEHQVYIILKGAHTAIGTPEGECFFNQTGNPGMATAGSGDVLTGMLTGLLARGYSPIDAAIIGVWLHGAAGDLAAEQFGMESMIASDIISFIPGAYKQLERYGQS